MTDKELLDAAQHGKTEKLREYLEGGADVNTKNENGWTLLVSEKGFKSL
jgi:ankyrin repeat protein